MQNKNRLVTANNNRDISDALKDLGNTLALIDLVQNNDRTDMIQIRLYKHSAHVWLDMKPDKKHNLPHFHIHYKTEYSASYSIEPIAVLAGENMPVKYSRPIVEWAEKNKTLLMKYWRDMKDGKPISVDSDTTDRK